MKLSIRGGSKVIPAFIFAWNLLGVSAYYCKILQQD